MSSNVPAETTEPVPRKDFLEACRRLIGIDSSPAAGTVEVARYVGSLASSLGFDVELQYETWNGLDQANVIIRPNRLSDVGALELMLETHLDTPDPGAYTLWAATGANPFNASIYQQSQAHSQGSSAEGDKIHGLGAADTKLDFLCKLFALHDVVLAGGGTKRPWRVPPVLVGTYGEELGMAGSVKLIRKKKVNPISVLVGEPTDCRIVVAGKGFASVEIEIPFSEEERKFREEHNLSESASSQSRLFRGKAAHSSSPHLGESAILKMLDALERMPQGIAIMDIEGGVNTNTVPAHAVLDIDLVAGLRDPMAQKLVRLRNSVRTIELEFQNFPDLQFTPAEPTLNIGLVRTYEDHVKIGGCVRLPPTVTQANYEKWMQVLREACEREGGQFRVFDYKPSFRTSEQTEIVQVCQNTLSSMGLDATLGAQSVANEANVFSKFGVNVVSWGPGQGVGNSHTPNEYVKIQDLEAAREFYRRVIEQVGL